ncbi:MAG: hypothetical protein AAF401_15985, partial [Pseudomonadota bacterium]
MLDLEIGEAEDEILPQTVWRRRVYYISGYDPQGPRRYYQLYRDESQVQAKISDYEIDVSTLTYEKGASAATWTAEFRDGEEQSSAEITMLRWDDIARSWMRQPIWAVYWLMLKTLWRYVGSGAFNCLLRIRRVSTLVGMYPVFFLTLYFLFAVWNGYAAMWLFTWLSGLPMWAASPLFFVVFYGIMRISRMIDETLLVYYLMCDFGFT